MSIVHFNPASVSCLSPAAETLRREIVDDLLLSDHTTLAYTLGSIEGELAFALSMDKDSPSRTLTRCKSQLLLRLGLEGSTLTLEQQRLRGWIVGLLESAASSLDEQDIEQATTA